MLSIEVGGALRGRLKGSVGRPFVDRALEVTGCKPIFVA